MKNRRTGSPPCDELREGDGIDPRHVKSGRNNREKKNYQDSRLCRQIEKVLALLFSGAGYDDRFSGLYVESVKPEPDISCLLVSVYPLKHKSDLDPDSILMFLNSAKTYLRKEVAREINRKRMPEFKFRLIATPDFLKI